MLLGEPICPVVRRSLRPWKIYFMPYKQFTSTARLRLAEKTDKKTKVHGVENWEEFFFTKCPVSVDIVGKSRDMLELLENVQMIAESRCNPILIVGETGTGKEQFARAVHVWRNNTTEDFLAINCAALTANLLESELFGHVRGAFTGADRDKIGLFEAAGNGTIFLDEISEMPIDLQAKLLRVLQEKKFRKVGGTKDISCQATIIATSNRELLLEIQENRFRQDLYYRLAVFPIQVPTLRSPGRRSDIPLLARFFLKTSDICNHDVQDLTPAAEQILMSHNWPGNVRELRNVIDRALILEKGKQISPANIKLDRPQPQKDTVKTGVSTESDYSLETAEREFITRALQETGWQRTRAAGLLGITRATLHAKLKRYGIKPPGAEIEIERTTEEEILQEACA